MHRAYARPLPDVLTALAVDPAAGLTATQVELRRARCGRNVLRRIKPRGAWRILFDQLASLMVGLLLAAAVVAFALVDWVEGFAILAVIVINTTIGFITELRARRSMEALQRLGQVRTRVKRDGRMTVVDAGDIVPGDVLAFEGGDVITADLRLTEGSNLEVDESALTGESVPVAKSIHPVAPDAPLAERTCMLFKGTAVTRGAGEGVVVGTGLNTELGRISTLVQATDDTVTPLERSLNRLGRRLIAITLGIVALLAAVGITMGRDLYITIETSIALAVATVPEGLPIVATIALARGMWRMARHHALINRLAAVETLGATGVLCTDKTGTLTENRMTVARIALPAGDVAFHALEDRFEWPSAPDPEAGAQLQQALEVAVLCNDSALLAEPQADGTRGVGDPMEVALLVTARAAGLDRIRLLESMPELRARAFDSGTMMMATMHRHGQGARITVKGAPEAVLASCQSVAGSTAVQPLADTARRSWHDRNLAFAREGLRVIGLAVRDCEDENCDPYEQLAFIGLMGLVDPPRRDVRAAVDRCRDAGIELVMVTGDQPETALYVARAVGLVDAAGAEAIPGSQIRTPAELSDAERDRLRHARVFARVSPEQKLNLIALHQRAGAIVAMTGDGVNDAPALKKADIGIAMGRRGTQVAREAADMVLTDDALGSIVLAIEQGRVIFVNIRRFVLYLLSCNVSEVMVIGLATLTHSPLPILPLQILFLNLVTDVFPALALGVGPGDPALMRQPPRAASEPVLTRRHWLAIAAYGVLITASVLAAFGTAIVVLELDPAAAVSVSFLTLALAQILHVFNMREPSSGVLRNDVTRNRWVWGACALCIALLVAAMGIAPLARLLAVETPRGIAWAVVVAGACAPLLIGQIFMRVRRGRHAPDPGAAPNATG
jgi:P-type Ca2+ transporter type 2C